MNKGLLFEKTLLVLEEKLKVLVESAFLAKEASTNEESKAENKYDTRGLEASYLAAGQAQRAQELQEQIYQTRQVRLREFGDSDPISISALVRLSINGELEKWFFVLPIGGVDVKFEDLLVQTITLDSPMGRCLHSSTSGDDFEINGKEYEILQVL